VSVDLILQARLELLRDNLERAHGVPGMLERQHESVATLLELLNSELSFVGQMPSLMRTLKKVKIDLEDLANDPGVGGAAVQPLAGVTDALKALEGAQEKLKKAADIVQQLHGRRVTAAEKLSGGTVVAALQADANDYLQKVQGLLESNGDTPSLADVWRSYAELAEEIGPRFDDCVDLLQGVSVREHGLEESSAVLFQLADKIIQPWRVTDFNTEPFTIPSRREADASARINVLRVGFSEWTLWTLPLVAFEFGQLAVSRSQTIRRFLEEHHADDRAAWEELIADGLATAALGPAYACAAVILRLGPPSAAAAGDNDRVRMILLTLARLNEKHAYDHVMRTLEEAWTVASGGAPPGSFPTARSDAALAEGVDFLLRQLGATILLRYPVTEFQSAQATANAASLEARDVIDPRNLVNLAWLFRLAQPAGHAATAELLLSLWTELQTADRPRSAVAAGRGLWGSGGTQPGGRK